MLLVFIDAYLKWVEAIEFNSLDDPVTKSVCTVCLPTTLVSDNGPQYTAQEFEEFSSSNGIKHIWVAPYYPSYTLTHRLSRVLMSYRNTPRSTSGIASTKLLFGRNLISKLDLLKPSADKKNQKSLRSNRCRNRTTTNIWKVESFRSEIMCMWRVEVVEIGGWQGLLQLCQVLCNTMLGCPMAVFVNVTRTNSESITMTLLKVMLWWMYLLVTHHLQ